MTSVIKVYVQTLLQLKLLKEENKQNTWHDGTYMQGY